MSAVTNGLRFYWRVLRGSISRFITDDALTHSAALAYFMVFSLPSMLLIILWAAGVFYQKALVSDAVFAEITALVGPEGSRQLMTTIEGLNIEKPGWWATAVTAGVMAFTASTVLVAGQNALNRIFRVEAEVSPVVGLWKTVRDRFLSVAMLVTIAFILSVSLALGALIKVFGQFLGRWIGTQSDGVTAVGSTLLEVVATSVLVGLLFRYLPDVRSSWRDIWLASIVTALMMMGGESLIGYLIGQSDVSTYYDAAGSILVLMLWVYYASAIFLFGAVFASVRIELLQPSPAGRGSS